LQLKSVDSEHTKQNKMMKTLFAVATVLLVSALLPSAKAESEAELAAIGKNAVKAAALLQQVIIPLAGVANTAIDWLANNLGKVASKALIELGKLAAAAGGILGAPAAGAGVSRDLTEIEAAVRTKLPALVANAKALISSAANALSRDVGAGVRSLT